MPPTGRGQYAPPEANWIPPTPPPVPPPFASAPPVPPVPEAEAPTSKFDLGAMLNMPTSFRETIREKWPEKLDLSDILLVLVLIYLFLEGDDDDTLIILGVLVVSWIWPLFRKDEA